MKQKFLFFFTILILISSKKSYQNQDTTLALENIDKMSNFADSKVSFDAVLASWMSIYLPNNAKLWNISLPGAHDAGANGNGGAAYQCQNNEIKDILKAGIRVLDLRLQVKNGTIWIVHEKSQQTKTLNEVLTQVRDFLITNNKETVLLTLKRDADDAGSTSLKTALIELLKAYSTSTYNSVITNETKMGNVRGKMVLFGRSGCSWLNQEFSNASVFGSWGDDKTFSTTIINGSNEIMSAFVADRYKVSTIFQSSYDNKYYSAKDNILNATKNTESGKWYLSFISGSGGLFPSPYRVAENITPRISDYLKALIKNNTGNGRNNLKNKCTGIIMGDFCTSTNFKKVTLNIINFNYYAFH